MTVLTYVYITLYIVYVCIFYLQDRFPCLPGAKWSPVSTPQLQVLYDNTGTKQWKIPNHQKSSLDSQCKEGTVSPPHIWSYDLISHKTNRVCALPTSHSTMASWFLSWMSQSSCTLSAQWWMVRMTGLVSRAPGGPQLTTGLRTVCTSSTGGLQLT